MPRLSDHKRIVIKIGSALLVDPGTGLRRSWLESLIADLASHVETGGEAIIVSSGAIALGRTVLNLPKRALQLDENQAAAAVGQIALGRAYDQALAARDLVAGQILLTLSDTEGRDSRRSYLNARDTIEKLLSLNAVPIVNENDTVATSEIRYGDNDRLAARVATMMGADCLVLLSDIDGLYTAPPADNPAAKFVAAVPAITADIEAMAGNAGSELSRGGMVTKIEAGKIATAAGTAMVIASGKEDHPIAGLNADKRATWFAPREAKASARKKWIAGQLETAGAFVIDDGAAAALRRGKSLLPAGVFAVEGDFSRGDTVAIREKNGVVIGNGLAAYDSETAGLIAGCKSAEVTERLGYAGRTEMVHRDNMVLIQD